MNTKQLTVLWYGVLAAVAILLVQGGGEVWASLAAVALVTAAFIYSLGPRHNARLGRVASVVAAPFLIAGLGVAAFHGYRSWRHNVVADAVTVRDVRVIKKPDCPSPRDSVDGSSSDEAGVTQSGVLSPSDPDLLPKCHEVEGILQNDSDAELRRVTLEVMVWDTAGQLLNENVELRFALLAGSPRMDFPGALSSAQAGAELEFSKSVHLPTDIEDQQVDSVRVREVRIDE